jgi:hypothetical protein
MTNWEAQDLKSLFAKIQRMPLNNPASLPDAVYMDIMTYILQGNAFPEGERDLSAEALEGIHIVRRDAESWWPTSPSSKWSGAWRSARTVAGS